MNIFRGLNPLNLTNKKNTIECQIIDWATVDKKITVEEEIEPCEYAPINYKFLIKAYGVTLEGTSICINIEDYPPHFFIEIPDYWNKTKIKTLINLIENDKTIKGNINVDSWDIVKRKKFYGFTNNKEFKFIRLLFDNTKMLYRFTKKFTDEKLKDKIKRIDRTYETKGKIYETNIPPLLRFIHQNKLEPAGWIKINPENYSISYRRDSRTQLEIDTKWKCIVPITKEKMAPFVIASFDIEADSSHGDFPLAQKDYKKLATELVTDYISNKHKTKDKIAFKTNFKDNIKSAFENGREDKISKIYRKNNLTYTDINLNKVVDNLYYAIQMKENYSILILDLLSLNSFKKTHLNLCIDDAFSDMNKFQIQKTKYINPYFKITNDVFKDIFVKKIHTLQNKKPTRKMRNYVRDMFLIIVNKFKDQLELYKDNIRFVCQHYFDKTTKETFSETFNLIKRIIEKLLPVFKAKFPEIQFNKEIMIERFNFELSDKGLLPDIQGDRVIQIGTTVQKYGEKECCVKHIATLGSCTSIENCIVEECENERDVLLKWTKFIQELDPDIITGYNIFGFDYKYMVERSKELDCYDEFMMLSRENHKKCILQEKVLSSSALGENKLEYIEMTGRVQMDLFKIVQRDHNLVSYKLDFVAETFINDTIINCKGNNLNIKGVRNINKGNYITIKSDNIPFNQGKKYKIIDIDYEEEKMTIEDNIELNDKVTNIWQLAKDDVSPNDIFRLQKGSAEDRNIIATYCIQDCALCLTLINKLQIITNNIAMSNVCFVPLSFIFMRGQGIKILSLVSRQCRKEKFIIPLIKCESNKQDDIIDKDDPDYKHDKIKFEWEEDIDENITLGEDDGYEGAIVLKPSPGIYLDKYVVVLDYASLYPSSMISENLSHDSIILDKKYLGEYGAKELKKLGYGYVDVTYDIYSWVDPKIKNKGKHKTGTKTCRYVQPPNGEKSVIPRILKELLGARKATKKKMKEETDDFQKSVLDGLQLAFKITANSLYGQIGARTSAIYLKDIAASTTAVGRNLLYMARDKTQEKFNGAVAIYGDTDSVFIDFKPKDEKGNLLKGKEGLKRAIELGVEAEKHIQQFLKPPHKLEYEKTFWPFILFSKKRYIGYKYEFDINKYKETSMGIVLKRRDNAEIVKHVYGTVMNILLKEKDLDKTLRVLNEQLNDLLDGKYPIEKLIITKSLRGYYKNPNGVAHKVLADRMGKRDPGNKPMTNDRIPYVYIDTKKTKDSNQGDFIEHPDYIKDNKLKPDYKFYITNQIMKPVGQIFALIVEDLKGYKKDKDYFDNQYKYYLSKYNNDEKKTTHKISEMRLTVACDIIFEKVLRKATNKKNNNYEITHFMKRK